MNSYLHAMYYVSTFLPGVLLLSFVLGTFAAIHAAKRERVAWVIVIICFPIIGWIAYWFNSNEEIISSAPRTNNTAPPAPPETTSSDIAAAITADLQRQKKNRTS